MGWDIVNQNELKYLTLRVFLIGISCSIIGFLLIFFVTTSLTVGLLFGVE